MQLQLAHGVVLLDDLKRLDKQGGAAGRLVVDDAVDLALGVGADGDNVAALALGDQRLLQIGLELGAVHQPV